MAERYYLQQDVDPNAVPIWDSKWAVNISNADATRFLNESDVTYDAKAATITELQRELAVQQAVVLGLRNYLINQSEYDDISGDWLPINSPEEVDALIALIAQLTATAKEQE